MTEINFNAITSVTEEDMGRAWEAFDKMRNAVVEGSKLASQFHDLESKVQSLQRQVETQLEQNKRLDDMYIATRRQRDEAQSELASVRNELDTAKQSISDYTRAMEIDKQTISNYENSTATLRKERDDAQYRAMEWEEKAEDFRKKLEHVQSTLTGLTSTLGIANPTSPPQFDQDKEDTEPSKPTVVHTFESVPVPLESSGGSPSGGGSPTETVEQRQEREKRQQPRDPVTQQWRSPNDPPAEDIPQAAKPWWQSEH